MFCGAQTDDKTSAQRSKGAGCDQTDADPLKRPLSEKQKKQSLKSLYKELNPTDRKWLDEDVKYIITDEEREGFLKLSNEEERDAFIEQFWLRRDPTPDTPENEFKEEHYRRIAYANEHFASGISGMAHRSGTDLRRLRSGRRNRLPSFRRILQPLFRVRVAVKLRPIPSRIGGIATSKASATKSSSSSSTSACATSTRSRSIRTTKTLC